MCKHAGRSWNSWKKLTTRWKIVGPNLSSILRGLSCCFCATFATVSLYLQSFHLFSDIFRVCCGLSETMSKLERQGARCSCTVPMPVNLSLCFQENSAVFANFDGDGEHLQSSQCGSSCGLQRCRHFLAKLEGIAITRFTHSLSLSSPIMDNCVCIMW